MLGWLIVNHFIKSPKYSEIFLCLEEAASSQGINLIRKTNVQVMSVLTERQGEIIIKEKPDFILFWDKDIRLAKYLETKGFRLFNSAEAIEKCDDKSLTHITLNGYGIKMPKTIIAPKTFENLGYSDYAFLHTAAEEIGFPMIIKECFGSFGQQVYLAENFDELLAKVKCIGIKPMLFQYFIASSRGRDIRINVVGGKPVASMYRYAVDGDFRANVSNGAHMEKYTPNSAQIELATQACEMLKLDFAGVDILIGENEEPILCEVNSNAHFKNIYKCSGINVADYILKHIKDEMKG